MGRKSFNEIKERYVSFEGCKQFAKQNGLTSFRKWYAFGPKPHNIPGDPTKYDEWDGWPNFTGSVQRDRRVDYCSYHESAMFAQSLEIKTSDEWKRFWLKKKMPDDKYPRSPQFIYGEEFKQNGGWKGFLGIEFMTYEEAKSYIQTFCFGSFNEYRAWSISENRPSNFYAVPHRCYDEFESYPEFIGYSQKQKQNVNNALELLDNRPAILAHLKIKRLSSFKEIITEIKRIDDDTGDEINRLVGENKKTKKQFSETIAAIKTG